MLKMVKKFFDFCNRENSKKFYLSVVLGVIEAIFTAMKIPAAFFAIDAVINNNVNSQSVLIVIGLMLLSTVGKTAINRYSMMLQTEAGYDTCAQKRIEIGEHLRYLPYRESVDKQECSEGRRGKALSRPQHGWRDPGVYSGDRRDQEL